MGDEIPALDAYSKGSAPKRKRPKRVQKKIDKRYGAATYAVARRRRWENAVYGRFIYNMMRKFDDAFTMPPELLKGTMPGGLKSE